jgi:CHASE2 domain-containing sensor protein
VVGDLHLRQAATPVSRRFIYEIPWKIERGKTRPVFDYQGSTVPLISIRSAGTITEHPERVDNSWLAGHIVIIGGSFSEGRDLFPTPIGQMPGALILVNAIHSLLQYGELGPPPLWLTLMLQVLLILIISLVFSRFDTFWGLLVSGGVVILLLLPVSIWVFRYGVWVDIALPLLAVQLHHMAAEFRENDALQESKRNVQT